MLNAVLISAIGSCACSHSLTAMQGLFSFLSLEWNYH